VIEERGAVGAFNGMEGRERRGQLVSDYRIRICSINFDQVVRIDAFDFFIIFP
jgi:hypothetical protein